jgi:CheY-like chemotaxis protein
MAATKHVILYADDDHDDQLLVRQAFQKYDSTIHIVTAFDGSEALDYLNKLDDDDPLPCLIILDINMPGIDGKQALLKIKQTEKLKSIPIVMFSTSSGKMDKEFAAKWSAEFITKPLTHAELTTIADLFVQHCKFGLSKRIYPS